MIDQLVIGKLASHDDFEASMKERKINAPKKKSIKETVPFSNMTYDFSAINGEVYWEERTLDYVFEIMAMSPEELAEKKQAFLSWIMNVFDEEIHDPYIKDYHFVGTYDSISIDDSEVEKSTISVAFTAYPYMISNRKKTYTYVLAASETINTSIVNKSSHRVVPTFVNNIGINIKMDNTNYSIGSGETTDPSFMLAAGSVPLTIQNTTSTSGTLKIEFYEEVF